MGQIFLSTFLLCTIFSFGQGFKKLTVDPSRQYLIQHEDSLYDHNGDFLKISSDLVVDDCSSVMDMCGIKFATAEVRRDTLDIEIFETNTVYDYKYRIKVIRGQFKVDFWYQTTMDTSDRRIETIDAKLVLNTGKLKRGSEIKGYTEYHGRCVKYCDGDSELYAVRGFFKAVIK